MFSPGTKRLNLSSRKDHFVGAASTDSPTTPHPSLPENRRPLQYIPNRPATGTPAPWASRLSTLARIRTAKRVEKADVTNPVQPVFVGEHPQVVRNEQTSFLQKHVHGDARVYGGMDKETSLAWIICGNKLFIWTYFSSASSSKCVVLELPSSMVESKEASLGSHQANIWLLCIVNWDDKQKGEKKFIRHFGSVGVLLCNKRTRALVYWPNIYSEPMAAPVISAGFVDESEVTTPVDAKVYPNKLLQHKRLGSSSAGSCDFNSLIACANPGALYMCVALACSSNGEIWQFYCSPMDIQRTKACQDMPTFPSQVGCGEKHLGYEGYPRSLIWHPPRDSLDDSKRLFLLLTDNEIQCYQVFLSSNSNVSKLWSHEIIGNDGDLGIQKDLAGQKQIWPLDMQIDDYGKVISVLIATFCKDRVSSSSYIQYSLLTMQYCTGVEIPTKCSEPIHDKVLEKLAPVQVIIPKARVEDEAFLFSMRLRIGGKPSGSAVILSSDGTASVSHYWRNSTRLYQFDLPNDAGKVFDASVFSPLDDSENGAWAVLTAKAGLWAIPEKAVLLGGVEPPERSLSRKGGSSNESSMDNDHSFGGNFTPRRASSEAWNIGDRQRAAFTGIGYPSAHDEETEALISQFFNDFLLSGKVDGALNKFRSCGAFGRDGEANIFTKISKSIVDTLAKHWTTTRGAEILAFSAISTQLMEKQQKHNKFLEFLALSKCHEELCSQQRESLLFIMEHGEKLSCMIHLRELQGMIFESHSSAICTSGLETETSGALWDLIQLVGEKARCNTVLLMDRDNAEVFYSKVSDLNEIFNCLERHLDCVINEKLSLATLLPRVCELSNACVILLRTAMHYRNEHHMWYPSFEGLTPWYCLAMVHRGLWNITSFMLQLSKKTNYLEKSAKLDFISHLETLAEVLLEAYSGAIRAQIERGEEQKSLLEEYWKKRDAVLLSIYQEVNEFYHVHIKDSIDEAEVYNKEILEKLSSVLLLMAKRHESYQTLWNVCCDLNDSEFLKNLMRESMGPKGGFSCFVFDKLYKTKQLSKLMRLGEEFLEELAIFLKHHTELRWLHEVFLHQFSTASETLHALALIQECSSCSESEEPVDTYENSVVMTLTDRERFLNLSKIAAVAGNNAGYDIKTKRIDADLKIMKLQEEISEVLSNIEEKHEMGKRLLPPIDLIELCLTSKNRTLSFIAFEVFAWTSSSFLKCNKSLLEECWRNAADQDDWGGLNHRYETEGWSDEDTFQVLRETILFQASKRCYGVQAEAFEGGFDELLPLRRDTLDFPTPKDILSSVEVILMQHKDFPDAGKLMLMATMLGSTQG